MGWGTLADYEEVESDIGLRTQAQPLAKNANLSSSSRLLTCWSGGRKMALPGFNAAATSKQHFPSPASGAGETAHASAMTKGNISLALSGHGTGWDIGVGFSGFTIKAAE